MCDSIVEQTAGRLSAITFLDLSYCGNIGARALETIGKHCKLLASLCRNMNLLDAAEKFPQDDEANAIAATMPKLKHLEMACHLITTGGVLNQFEFLNLYGCGNVKLDNQLLKEKFPKLKVLGPVLIIYYKKDEWGDCSYYSDSSEYLGWEFEMGDYDDYDIDHEMRHNEGRLEELELGFYEGIGEDARIFGWPPSP